MQITYKTKNDVIIAALSGKLVAGDGAVVFYDQIMKQTDRSTKNILVDLTGIQMMDSSGLGELVRSAKAINTLGGALKLLNPGPSIRQVIDTARLTSYFETFTVESTAIQSFER